MSIKRIFSILLFYFSYNLFLKFFFYLFNHILYKSYPENIDQINFFHFEGDNLIDNIISNIFLNVISDWFWLLPFTILNIYIFLKLLKLLAMNEVNIYERMSFILLKVYFIWCLIYLFSIGIGLIIKENTLSSLIGGPFAPYGSYAITYFLLGNFTFLLLFIPLWNRLSFELRNKI